MVIIWSLLSCLLIFLLIYAHKQSENPVNTKHLPQISGSCKNISKNGSWLGWQSNGFERILSVNRIKKKVTNILDPNWPITTSLKNYNLPGLAKKEFPGWWYPFLAWKNQNFSGYWSRLSKNFEKLLERKHS